MIKKIVLFTFSIFLAGFLYADASNEAKVLAINKVLKDARLTHFERRKSPIPKKKLRPWLKKAVPAVKKALAMLPEGYHIHIFGHADNRGGKNYNEKLSKKRARAALNALKKAGVKIKRIKYEGKGFKDLLDAKNPTSGLNRAISFEVVKD